MAKPTYAIAVGFDVDELSVVKTDDGFGVFETEAGAANRIIEIVDARIKTLRNSRSRAWHLLSADSKSPA